MFRVFLVSLLCIASSFAQARSYIDGHLHYVDFFQESEGMPALLKAMDEGNISHAAVMGIPVAKKWQEDEPKKPRYYAGDDAALYWYSATDSYLLHAIEQLKPAEQKRFFDNGLLRSCAVLLLGSYQESTRQI